MPSRSDSDLGTWIAEHDFVAFTAHTVTDLERFRAELREARAQDYWATTQQSDPSFGGISVALKDRRGSCQGAIGMTVLAASYSPEQMRDKLLLLLRETAQSLRPLL